jgi:hypothetical protein
VSPFSYFEANTLWLEEDCDASLLIEALERSGTPFTLRHVHVNTDAYVRNLPRWNP